MGVGIQPGNKRNRISYVFDEGKEYSERKKSGFLHRILHKIMKGDNDCNSMVHGFVLRVPETVCRCRKEGKCWMRCEVSCAVVSNSL